MEEKQIQRLECGRVTGVIQIVLSQACSSATLSSVQSFWDVSDCLPEIWQKRVSFKTMDEKARERWSVVETVAQLT